VTPPVPALSLGETWSRLRADVDQLLPHMGATHGLLGKLSLFSTPAVTSVALHRFAHWLAGRGLLGMAGFLSGINYVVNKITISPGARIGPGLFIPHPAGVVFHAHAGERLTLYHRAMVCPRAASIDKLLVPSDSPRLGDDVTVGAYSVVSGPVSVGNGTFVGVNVVLTEDVSGPCLLVDRLSIRIEREAPDAS